MDGFVFLFVLFDYLFVLSFFGFNSFQCQLSEYYPITMVTLFYVVLCFVFIDLYITTCFY